MTYRDKIRALLLVSGVLALMLVSSYVFDPERSGARNSLYTWLDKRFIGEVDRIELGSPGSADSEVTLLYRDGAWKALLAGELFPAKEERVEDLFALLSRRAGYPVRAASEASRERLGVNEARAGHIRLYGGANATPLLNILVGGTDALGSDVYLRKSGEREIRSGERSFSSYAGSRRQSWYDLRLFRGSERVSGVDQVQRVELRYPPGSGKDPVILERDSGAWTVNNGKAAAASVDSYIRTLLNAEADDFVPSLKPSDPFFNQGAINIELDDGTRRALSLGPALDDGKRGLLVSGSPYVYALAEWTVGRLFRDSEAFLAAE